MSDNIHGALDIYSGTETVTPHFVTADNRPFSLLAILKRPENGAWQLLKDAHGLPLRSGDIVVPGGNQPENALVILLYTQDGDPGHPSNGIGAFTLSAPADITFDITGDEEDLDITLESILMPPVIQSVEPAIAMVNGNYCNSWASAVQVAPNKLIHLKDDASMGGTLTSIISLVNGANMPIAAHSIPFKYQENNYYIVCYDVVPPTPPKKPSIDAMIAVMVSYGVMVGADGVGIVNGHIIHIPGNNPLSQIFAVSHKEVAAAYRSLAATVQKLSTLSDQHAKELNQIRTQQRVVVAGKVADIGQVAPVATVVKE